MTHIRNRFPTMAELRGRFWVEARGFSPAKKRATGRGFSPGRLPRPPFYANCLLASLTLLSLAAFGCGHGNNTAAANVASAAPSSSTAAPTPQTQPAIAPEDQAPPASQTAGFDGQKAYDFTAKLVSFGPRPPASDAIHHTQDYIVSTLKSFGCAVDTDDFHASTPVGDLAMKNIVAKIPGTGQGIILLLTHYDTVRLDNFVGADDGGSSSGLMLEMARVLCGSTTKQSNSVWIAFLDGEEEQMNFNNAQEAQTIWHDPETTYGSRELAAQMAVSGEIKHVRALILADMIGQKNLQVPPEANSTKWLADLVWKTADRLHYKDVFVPNQTGGITDDHGPFLKRGVASVDIIELSGYPYWHSTDDTMDKLSPKSFAVVGHVILASVGELQQKFH
jgi:glutaminyl-peptide cyclotransferase